MSPRLKVGNRSHSTKQRLDDIQMALLKTPRTYYVGFFLTLDGTEFMREAVDKNK